MTRDSDQTDEVKHLREELESLRVYYRDNLPTLIGIAQEKVNRLLVMLSGIDIYNKNAHNQLVNITTTDPVEAIARDSISFFMQKQSQAISEAIALCNSEVSLPDQPVKKKIKVYDYVFNEFKVSTGDHTVLINDREVHITTSEFGYLLPLIKNPNRDTHFEKPDHARTYIARLKLRVPELKDMIKTAFGKASYRLVVSPLTSKSEI